MKRQRTLIKEIKDVYGENFRQHPRFLYLRKLHLADIPGIRKYLIDAEREVGTPEEEIEDYVGAMAFAVKSNSFPGQVGRNLRKMAVFELFMHGFKQYEIAIILTLPTRTIRRVMKELGIHIQNNLYRLALHDDF